MPVAGAGDGGDGDDDCANASCPPDGATAAGRRVAAGGGVRSTAGALATGCGVAGSAAGVGGSAVAGAVVAGAAVGGAVGRGVARCGDGLCVGASVGGAAVGAAVSEGVGRSVGTLVGEGALARGVGEATATTVFPTGCIDAIAAPIASPATTTPTEIGITGKVDPWRLRRVGGVLREAIEMECSFRSNGRPRAWDDHRARSAKRRAVIRVSVPTDVGTIAETASDVFAAATPLRVAEILILAVREALGERAPHDKLERGIHATLAGFATGEFDVQVDGRSFRRLDDVVVCAGVATLRFFARSPRRVRRT